MGEIKPSLLQTAKSFVYIVAVEFALSDPLESNWEKGNAVDQCHAVVTKTNFGSLRRVSDEKRARGDYAIVVKIRRFDGRRVQPRFKRFRQLDARNDRSRVSPCQLRALRRIDVVDRKSKRSG